MEREELDALMGALRAMPDHLTQVASLVGEANASAAPEEGAFSLVEHVWHLADLEGEAYAVRLRRLREEASPELVDFDGTQVARERNYRGRDLCEGLFAFARLRSENLKTLAGIESHEWARAGTQELMGPVRLEDVPRTMVEHDATHRAELLDLLRTLVDRAAE